VGAGVPQRGEPGAGHPGRLPLLHTGRHEVRTVAHRQTM